jgi:hypothetical protein
MFNHVAYIYVLYPLEQDLLYLYLSQTPCKFFSLNVFNALFSEPRPHYYV